MKDVLITGGTRNNGFVIAKTFAGAGYRVHITGRKLEDVKTAAERIKSEYPEAKVTFFVAVMRQSS